MSSARRSKKWPGPASPSRPCSMIRKNGSSAAKSARSAMGTFTTSPLVPERSGGFVPWKRGHGRLDKIAGPGVRDPRVDPRPPVVQPLDLGLVVGRTGHELTRHPPPSGPDDLVDGKLSTHVADRDAVVEPGVRHEDHVVVGAGRDGG